MKLVPFASRPRRRQPSAPAPGHRARMTGVIVLAVGLLTAGLVYLIETRQATADIDELQPGYSGARSRADSRQMGIFYGHAGEVMWGWRQTLAQPETHAAIIAGVAVVAALICFRVAWLDAEHARE